MHPPTDQVVAKGLIPVQMGPLVPRTVPGHANFQTGASIEAEINPLDAE